MAKLVKLAIICIAIAVLVLAIDCVIFHYVTDDGFPTEKQEESGKPLVTQFVGQFGVLFLLLGTASLLVAFVRPEKNANQRTKTTKNATPWWQKQRENLGQTPLVGSLFFCKNL